jgi:hypothetical protein
MLQTNAVSGWHAKSGSPLNDTFAYVLKADEHGECNFTRAQLYVANVRRNLEFSSPSDLHRRFRRRKILITRINSVQDRTRR